MPLLAEISTAQPVFHSFPRTFNAQSCIHFNKSSLASLFIGDERELFSSFNNSLTIPKKMNFNTTQLRAVATLESKLVVQNGNEKNKGSNDSLDGKMEFRNSQVVSVPSTSDVQLAEELDERERLRRERISIANKGNTPWNKGRKHSAETLRRIKERTRLAMQDPKVKMKLMKLGHAQSKETRMKIGVGVRMGWQRRREKLIVQETCHFEWQNLIAEASRQGCSGEEELHWDSYKILNEKLKKDWSESVEQRKKMPRPVGSRRAPKSAEQKRKISESISAKWADPEYRTRVCSALAEYHGTSIGVNRRPRKKQSESAETAGKPPKKGISDINFSASGTKTEYQLLKFRKNKAPRFKDPLVSSKLEMIKNIRAQRATAETQKTEAIERARLLIAEAEKAAEALEVAATKSPIAQASLIETRKLIAEAIQLIESVDPEQSGEQRHSAAASYSYKLDSLNGGGLLAGAEDQNQAVQRVVNGTQLLSSSMDKDFELSKFSLQNLLNGEKELQASSNGYGVSHSSFSSPTNQPQPGPIIHNGPPNGNKVSDHKLSLNGTKSYHLEEKADSQVITVTKRWVRGRLIEVSEGA